MKQQNPLPPRVTELPLSGHSQRGQVLLLRAVAILAFWLWTALALAGEQAAVVQLGIRLVGPPSAGVVEGQATLSLDRLGTGEAAGVCLLLAYNAGDYEDDPGRGYSPTLMRFGRNQRQSGHIRVTSIRDSLKLDLPWTEVAPHVIRLPGATGSIAVKFRSRLPRWADHDGQAWFLHEFFPIPLERCPAEGSTASTSLSRVVQGSTQVNFTYPAHWSVFHPGSELSSPVNLTPMRGSQGARQLPKQGARQLPKQGARQLPKQGARQLRFVLESPNSAFLVSRKHRVQRFMSHGNRFEFVHSTDDFIKDIKSMERIVGLLSEGLGRLPGPRLLVVETDSLEKSMIPGVVAMNRPRGRVAGARPFQWHLWQLAHFSAGQWLGALMPPPSVDDIWLQLSLSDAVAAWVLGKLPEETAFFARGVDGSRPLDFTYRQAQDLVAGILTLFSPFNRLTDPMGRTREPTSKRHGFSYIRSSLGLRYLGWWLGEDRLIAILRRLGHQHRGRKLGPGGLLEFMRQQGPGGMAAAEQLLDWWSSDGWPDFSITSRRQTRTAGQRWLTEIEINQSNSDFELDVDIQVTTESGQKMTRRLVDIEKAPGPAKAPGTYRTSFLSDTPVAEVSINPQRQIFDADRFDNSDNAGQFHIVPGSSVRTFNDDGYTTFWLPLLAKLPGEDLSLYVTGVVLPYLHAAYTTLLAYVPSENRLGFQGVYLTDLPRLGMYTVLRANQDQGNTWEGQRLLEAGVYKKPFLLRDPQLELGLRVRSRQTLGHEESLHQTLALRFQLDPLNQQDCYYRANIDLESTPGPTSGGFSYNRPLGLARLNCRVGRLDLGLRVFTGALMASGEEPEDVRFKPQSTDGARLRLDHPELEGVGRIHATGLDLLWPLRLPFSVPFSQPRQARLRLYYDYAMTQEPRDHLAAAGGGVLLPFGGDAVGKQSISILQFSVLLVAHRRYEGQSHNGLGVLVDFFGQL